MNLKQLIVAIFSIGLSIQSTAQISAKLMKDMDVSDTHIAFVYGGDIWLVRKEGGQAIQLTSSPGEETYPKFSPDGQEIAYTAAYNGNADVYVIPTTGGIPHRVTYASYYDRIIEWHPDGNQLVFASRREAGIPRVNQFFIVDKEGGMPRKMAVPYGELASFSPDGNKLVYTTKITENYPFKRYRGGLTSDVIIFDLQNNSAENITNRVAIDSKPAWGKDKIYYLSDDDNNMRLNVWSYDPSSKENKKITSYSDFDISHISAGPNDLVFEAGGILYLMPQSSETPQEVEVTVVNDLSTEMTKSTDVSKMIRNMSASPEGKRVVFEARGELFNVPAKEGYTMNLTNSSGAFDQSPSWSPDGDHIAYWSDKSGEYELYIQNLKGDQQAKKLTSRKKGFGYDLFWSPDSKKIAFVNEKNIIQFIDISSGKLTKVDESLWNISHPGRTTNYPISWSPDSKYITYSLGQDNANNAILIYSLEDGKRKKVTSGFYSDFNPVFSSDGKYLFYLSDREFNPAYSGLNDGTWIYPNNTQVVAMSLTKDIPNILKPLNDDVNDEKKEKDKANNKEDEELDAPDVEIDWDGMESRVVPLPVKSGNYYNIMAFDGKLVYIKIPFDRDGKPSLEFYDIIEREEKTIMEDVSAAMPTPDNKSILVGSQGKYGFIKPDPDQKIKDPVPTDGLVMELKPKEEWRQIFNDTWRRYRDFFYDEDMQQVDWKEMKERYGALIDDARTKWDVINLQANLISELSAGHTYAGGGDTESVDFIQTGYLGIDWAMENGKYKIKRIVKPAPWDVETRSPIDMSGSEISEGDYVLAVNNRKLDPEKDPYAAFEGLAGKTVSLLVSATGKEEDAKRHTIKLLGQREESNLRYLEWIDNNRKKVDELSDGQLGYIYMSNTSRQGQLELVRMYYGQLDKKGFIIDERFNGGGQLADRFLELMQRPVVYNLYWRHGKSHQHPIKANTGPMGMLINGWAGSGGDALPWAFQELEAGPIVGERTLGILVGPATRHRLIDGGFITVPGARLYDNDGHWFWEGEGVKPDYKVWDDPNMLVKGRDPQMEKVVTEVLKLLEKNPPHDVPPPPMEDRTAEGLQSKK